MEMGSLWGTKNKSAI